MEVQAKETFPQTKTLAIKEKIDAPLTNVKEAVAMWKVYQDLINALMKTEDIVVIRDKKVIKKSGLNKIAKFFGYNCEIVRAYKEDRVGPRGGRNFIWRVWVKVIAPTGRFRVSGAACSSTERRFTHLEHDVYAMAETRAKKRAIEELAGMGEIELEENSKPEDTKFEFSKKEEEPQENENATPNQIEVIETALKRLNLDPGTILFEVGGEEKRIDQLTGYDGKYITNAIKIGKEEFLQIVKP